MKNRLQKIEKAINSMSDEKFSELLNELGVKVSKRWVPEIEDKYWVVDNIGEIYYRIWKNDKYDNYQLLMKNVFKTREEAETQRDFNIEKAKLIKEIEDSSDVIDWEDGNQLKYYLYYEYIDKEVYICDDVYLRSQGTTYTTNGEFLENLIKNEPERIKKYLFGIE